MVGLCFFLKTKQIHSAIPEKNFFEYFCGVTNYDIIIEVPLYWEKKVEFCWTFINIHTEYPKTVIISCVLLIYKWYCWRNSSFWWLKFFKHHISDHVLLFLQSTDMFTAWNSSRFNFSLSEYWYYQFDSSYWKFNENRLIQTQKYIKNKLI